MPDAPAAPPADPLNTPLPCTERSPAERFAAAILLPCLRGDRSVVEGWEIEEAALAAGLIKEVQAQEPCGARCACSDLGVGFPTTCNRLTEAGKALGGEAEVFAQADDRPGEALASVAAQFGPDGLRAVAIFMHAMGADAFLTWGDDPRGLPCDLVMQEAWARGGAPLAETSRAMQPVAGEDDDGEQPF